MSSSDADAPAPDSVLPPSKGYRGWRAIVFILGAVNLIAFGAVIAAIIVRTTRPVEPAAPFVANVPAKGQLVESVNLDANRILLRLSGAEGQEIVVLDANTGRLIGRIRLQAN